MRNMYVLAGFALGAVFANLFPKAEPDVTAGWIAMFAAAALYLLAYHLEKK